MVPRYINFSLLEISIIRNKRCTFALDKTQPSRFPSLCGVPIAQRQRASARRISANALWLTESHRPPYRKIACDDRTDLFKMSRYRACRIYFLNDSRQHALHAQDAPFASPLKLKKLRDGNLLESRSQDWSGTAFCVSRFPADAQIRAFVGECGGGCHTFISEQSTSPQCPHFPSGK